METLIQMFKPMIVFVYHCFDRIVINGYISMLSRPESLVYFFHNVVGQPCITKETLALRTQHYKQENLKLINHKYLLHQTIQFP